MRHECAKHRDSDLVWASGCSWGSGLLRFRNYLFILIRMPLSRWVSYGKCCIKAVYIFLEFLSWRKSKGLSWIRTMQKSSLQSHGQCCRGRDCLLGLMGSCWCWGGWVNIGCGWNLCFSNCCLISLAFDSSSMKWELFTFELCDSWVRKIYIGALKTQEVICIF